MQKENILGDSLYDVVIINISIPEIIQVTTCPGLGLVINRPGPVVTKFVAGKD